MNYLHFDTNMNLAFCNAFILFIFLVMLNRIYMYLNICDPYNQ